MIEQSTPTPTTTDHKPIRETVVPEKWQPEEIRKSSSKKRPKLEFKQKKSIEGKKGGSGQYKHHKPLLLLRQMGKCTFCSTPLGEFNTQVDHIIPKRFVDIYGKDKLNSPENLHAICCVCHNIKSWRLDSRIQSFVTAHTAFSTSFEDAIEHVNLFMNKEHAKIRSGPPVEVAKETKNEVSVCSGKRKERDHDSGYFSAKSYDSDVESVEFVELD